MDVLVNNPLPAANLKLAVQLQEKTFPGEIPGELGWRLWVRVSIDLAYSSW